jgi:DNA-binding NarL/FixJ family response regulator
MSDPRLPFVKPRGLPRESRRRPQELRTRVMRACRGLPSLTLREREVVIRLAQGRTNRQIGTDLNVSPRTIEKHVERILAKLGAANRTVAALLAARASDQQYT